MRAPEPLARPCCEEAVTKTWNLERSPVTILVVTRNHESYIDNCLGGVLAQVTSFPFSVLVYDAGSDDDTLNLLEDFQRSFPNIISIFQDNDLNGLPLHPAEVLLPKLETEIVFLCDGDDYWTDSQKIEKQAKMLTADTRLAGVYHQILELDVSSGAVADRFADTPYMTLSQRNLLRGAWVPTSTLAYRNFSDVQDFEIIRCLTLYDVWLGTKLGTRGPVAYADDITPSVAHIHKGGSWSGLSSDERVLTKANDERLIAKYYEMNGSTTESRMMMSRSIRTWASLAGGERRRVCALLNALVQEIRASIVFFIHKRWRGRLTPNTTKPPRIRISKN